MIFIDLKIALFVVLLGIGIMLGSWWLLIRRRVETLQQLSESEWSINEMLPFGVVLLENGAVRMSNAAARQLLQAISAQGESMNTIHFFDDPSQSRSERSGILLHPLPIRWWRYVLDDQSTLLVLIDWSDQQRVAREQQVFLGQLSHELRNPLTSLIAHAEVLRSRDTDELVRQSSAELVQREAQRMARLVRDLLELHRLETADDFSLQPTDVALVAEDVIAQLILSADEHGLTLTFDAGTSLPRVWAQPDRLKQVFLNVLDNAIKYCRPSDAINVRLEARPAGVLCIVQDNGPGIGTTDLPHVKERLYRGATNVEGSGLGLSLANEILRRHHTTLVIESSTTGPASGTTVSWTLPYATSTAAA